MNGKVNCMDPQVFQLKTTDPGICAENGVVPIPGATWYRTDAYDTCLHYDLAAGALRRFAWLTSDLLLDGDEHAVFRVVLGESTTGRSFVYRFGLLNQVGARLRLPLAAVDQSRWQTGREGALLKPMCCGDTVDLGAVDRMTFMVEAKGDGPVRFCMTPLAATADAPPLLDNPVLPAGLILDDMGQSRLRSWPTKSRSCAEVTARLHHQLAAAGSASLPASWSAWGGWTERTFAKTGFFRSEHDGTRWWLVDPDGYAFWSMGVDCVRSQISSYLNTIESSYSWLPERDGPFAEALTEGAAPHDRLRFVDFLRVNLIRAFGADWHAQWAKLALAELRRMGFNTMANWSEWQVARAARVPYVRPLVPKQGFESMPMVFRDFPDVFDGAFPAACTAYARQLDETRDDPALIGYFLMNEPTWGFAAMSPAEGMLRNYPAGPGRTALADWLLARHGGDEATAAAWNLPVSRLRLLSGLWDSPLTEPARQDLVAFSAIMVDRLFGALSAACRAVDPNHLNLGARYYTIPPIWMAAAMRHFDVFSINGYKDRFPAAEMDALYELVRSPIMIGEWHFGALDVGLPGNCLRGVASQRDRGKAFRVYAEGALAHPACVGAHWFTLYDESPMGRFDGENWNTGFLDVCHQPYKPLAAAARRTHERLYAVAAGSVRPYASTVAYRRTNIL